MDESPPLEHNLGQPDLLEPHLPPDSGLTSRSNSYRGSISSSLASPDKETPNRLQRDESDSPASRGTSAVLGDTPSRIYDHLPTPSPLRSVGRTATTGVGLGIPTLSSGGVFGRGWETGRREGEGPGSPLANVSRGPREEYTEEDYFSRPEQHRDRRGSVVDKATGLPSPPGTNSDITAPIEDQSSSSLMVEVSCSDLSEADPFSLHLRSFLPHRSHTVAQSPATRDALPGLRLCLHLPKSFLGLPARRIRACSPCRSTTQPSQLPALKGSISPQTEGPAIPVGLPPQAPPD